MSQLLKECQKVVNIEMNTTVGAIANSLDQTDAISLIKAIDLSQQDSDFTIELIKELFTSLRVDIDHEDGKILVKELKALNKYITNKNYGEELKGECNV